MLQVAADRSDRARFASLSQPHLPVSLDWACDSALSAPSGFASQRLNLRSGYVLSGSAPLPVPLPSISSLGEALALHQATNVSQITQSFTELSRQTGTPFPFGFREACLSALLFPCETGDA
jgi:hypothetical protein